MSSFAKPAADKEVRGQTPEVRGQRQQPSAFILQSRDYGRDRTGLR
jgi:hypothetical protein